MAKKIKTVVKLQIPGGKANPAPPVGPALGQHGLNIHEFCTRFNETTKDKNGDVVPVEITIYEDRSFDFVTKTSPAAELLKKAAKIEKGSDNPLKNKVGKVTKEQIRQIAADNYQKLVMKPLFGSQGQGVRKLLSNEVLPVPMQQFVDGVYYLQQLIETADVSHDYRVLVVGNKIVAAMKRTGASWVSNVAAGGRCEAVRPSDAMVQLALQAAKAVGIDYCGVDIIQAATGEYYVLEVNSIPAWRGLQGVTDFNIAEVLVDDFLNKLQAK